MSSRSNRLVHESSPYLLQHARNPVNWYPWGDEAFAEAKRRDVPVFLSIGYSTCHWCHVMERECFEDEEVAEALNAGYVCIKVDREERPDIDHVYMSACAALTGQGGWPLSCFITPDKKPFFAGTYFPKHDRYGMRGFMTILAAMRKLWLEDRNRLINASEDLLVHLAGTGVESQAGETANASDLAFEHLASSFDKKNGGFGHAPKFPAAHNLLFLIRYHMLYKEPFAAEMVSATLRAMLRGGIWDHIGGGFCRYSTDERWLVPHFEKMMYDNAMLAIACSEAGAGIDEFFFRAVRAILAYAAGEMLDSDGGYYTAQDADSEGVEGKFYVFTPGEIREALGAADGERFCRMFDITTEGNFEGGSIPNLLSSSNSAGDDDFAEKCFPSLFRYRLRRVPPLKDDKKLASVNGLMLAALSTAGRLMHDPAYLKSAEKTASFILDHMFSSGRLQASYRSGKLRHPATSDDYAYVLWGIFELYQADPAPRWLRESMRIADAMLELFKSGEGSLYLAGHDVHDLPVRAMNAHDGALPSGNSIAAQVLLRLGFITGLERYRAAADEIIGSLSGAVRSNPGAYTGLLCADLLNRQGGMQAILACADGCAELRRSLERFNPFLTIAFCGRGFEEVGKIAPHLSGYAPASGSSAVYVCSPRGCMAPLTDPVLVEREISLPPA